LGAMITGPSGGMCSSPTKRTRKYIRAESSKTGRIASITGVRTGSILPRSPRG